MTQSPTRKKRTNEPDMSLRAIASLTMVGKEVLMRKLGLKRKTGLPVPLLFKAEKIGRS